MARKRRPGPERKQEHANKEPGNTLHGCRGHLWRHCIYEDQIDMPKIVDHDTYREEIVDRCIEIFSKKGYANVTMRELAKELGVSTGLLYHYFPTKKAIFAQMFEKLRAFDVDRVLEMAYDSLPREEKLDIYSEHWSSNRDYYQNLILLALDYYRTHLSDEQEGIMRGFSDFYTKAMADNLETRIPEATLFFIFMIGLFCHDLLIPDMPLFNEQLNLMKEIVNFYLENHKEDIAEKAVGDRTGK
jgi:AcrR family transcriptional regulator